MLGNINETSEYAIADRYVYYHVEDGDKENLVYLLDIEKVKEKIGIVYGASTPDSLIDEIVGKLKV